MTPRSEQRSGGRRCREGGGDGPQKRRDRRRERARDDNGQFADSITAEDVLSVFDAVDGPVVTSSDVGDVLAISTEAARQKLNALVEDDTLACRKTGRTRIYWQHEGA
ncbi:hypothetical protein [Halorhabdus rudnickae]|uniref:hypothetical protein n=1 Tax=Halorhabdus rudnickae TaxID=1775544 RepID=UPI001AEF3F49|nr:hypothetical protein [Halorhabdus rudnickae]